MKIKLWLFLFLSTICGVFVACDGLTTHLVTPKLYQTEIEDYVTFEVSLMDVMIKEYHDLNEYSNSVTFLYGFDSGSEYIWEAYYKNMDIFESAMLDLWLKKKNDNSEVGFKELLTMVSETPNHKYTKVAMDVLESYNTTNIILSEYKEIPTSSDGRMWHFKELNTGIVFTVKIDPMLNWEIDVDEDSIERFFLKKCA